MNKNWKCPYCNQNSVVTSERFKSDYFTFNNNNKLGELCLTSVVTVCANQECREFTISTFLSEYKSAPIGSGGGIVRGKEVQQWNLRPTSSARPFPDYIPKPIIDDYSEACAIRDLSPKASATLSRRALQGMIRDFWTVQKRSLFDEIDAVKDKVDDLSWQAMDGLRKCGNIGAHMEKDINVIVDVDPNEAAALIGLIEMLLEEWYVARFEREKKLKNIVLIGNQKDTAKGGRN